MRALILAPGRYAGVHTHTGGLPLEMTCLLDRPFLQHAVETLVACGVTRLDVVESDRPELVESLLGTGERWGISITYHLVRDADRPYRPLRSLLAMGEDLWIAHGDRLPSRASLEQAQCSDPVGPVTIGDHPGLLDDWSGWAFLPAGARPPFPLAANREDLETWIEGLGASRLSTEACLSMRSSADVLEAHATVLDGRFNGLLISGREVSPGVRVARTARLHPDVELVPPVYIGESSMVGPGSRLGPYAVVGGDAVVEAGSSVSRSLVRGGSYLGGGLKLSDSIVDGDRLVSISHGVAIEIRDERLFGPVPCPPLLSATHLAERILAAVTVVICMPVLTATVAWLAGTSSGPVIRSVPIARASDSPGGRPKSTSIRTLDPDFGIRSPGERSRLVEVLLRFLPVLIYVAAGRMRVVGVQPRRPDELERLPEQWRALYLRSDVGLITEADVNDLVRESPDLKFASEAYTASRPGWKYAVLLCLVYLRGRGAADRTAGAFGNLTMTGVDS